MAVSMSVTIWPGSLLPGIQTTVTPRSAAAASAPRLTTDQNGPSSEWVIMWKVRSEPWVRSTASPSPSVSVAASSWPASVDPSVVSAVSPPDESSALSSLPHAAVIMTSASNMASQRIFFIR